MNKHSRITVRGILLIIILALVIGLLIKLVIPNNTSVDNGLVGTTKSEDLVGSNKPIVELFVMSYCPYGLQMEKAIIPVVETLGDEIDFQLRFVDYIMHGPDEIAENTRQYCIQSTQNDKLIPYLSCFTEFADPVACGEATGVDEGEIDFCIKNLDEEKNISLNFVNESLWINGRYPQYLVDAEANKNYGVRGSPTLVINGVTITTPRNSRAIMAYVCNSFNEIPIKCNDNYELMSESTPIPGFGAGTDDSGIVASCE